MGFVIRRKTNRLAASQCLGEDWEVNLLCLLGGGW